MRKNFHNRLTALGVILFLFVGIDVVIASPGINGGHSYWRVKTVSPIQARTFSVGNTTLYRQTDAGSDSELEVKNINLFFDLSYAFTDNFDLYAEAPYLSIDNGETESGLGDVIAGSRLAFPMSGAPFRVGLDVFAIMATGADMFTANSNDVGFRAIFDLNFNRFGFVINSGYLAVEKFDADSHRNRLLNGAALFFRPFLSLESGVELTAETVIQNEMDFMKSPVRVSPFLRWTHRSGFGMHLGGDIRISEDVSGEPDWGVGGGLSWTYRGTRSDPQHENQPKYEPQREETISDHPVAHTRIALTGGNDEDGDSIPNNADNCPYAREDFDGFQDSDGCPDEDNDNDGILDIYDCAPDFAEVFNNYFDKDGIPDGAGMSDQDQDGVPDQFDAAPHDPEDRDNFEDCDGIPDVDNDGDGVWDVHDTEPNRPGNPDIASRKDWNPYNIPANEPQTEGGQRNQRTAYPPSSQARQTPKFYPAATTPSASSNLPSTTASAFAAAQSATPSESDKDGDTIPNDVDNCPYAKEDFDGFQDGDGCPDEDNDNDGILDIYDCAPDFAEVFNNYFDKDGIPDGAGMSDQDQDGLPDQFDAAPHDPEDRDNFEDCDGIPDVDNDGDGVWDVHDTEPNRPGNIDVASRKDWNPYNIPANEPQTEAERRNQTPVYPSSSQVRGTQESSYSSTASTVAEVNPGSTSPGNTGERVEWKPTKDDDTIIDKSRTPNVQFPVITFDKESSELTEDMLKKVEKTGKIMEQYPRLIIRITGYSIPEERLFTPQANLGLQRAEAIKRQLILAHGISSTRMKEVGVELTDTEKIETEMDQAVSIQAIGNMR